MWAFMCVPGLKNPSEVSQMPLKWSNTHYPHSSCRESDSGLNSPLNPWLLCLKREDFMETSFSEEPLNSPTSVWMKSYPLLIHKDISGLQVFNLFWSFRVKVCLEEHKPCIFIAHISLNVHFNCVFVVSADYYSSYLNKKWPKTTSNCASV